MQLYLVPCNCGESLRVRVSQAGEQLTCQCGAAVSVPTIRGLKQLKTVADENLELVAPMPMWQGPAFALGLIALFAGCLLVAFNEVFPPAEMHGDATHVGLSEADIQRAAVPVSKLGLADMYDEFVALRDRGRNEYSQHVQSQIDQARRSYSLRRTIGLSLGGLGLLLTIAGLAPLFGKKP